MVIIEKQSDPRNFYGRYKKNIEPVIAFSVLIILIFGVVQLYKDNKLKEKIRDNCGYETKGYTCYCEKGFVDEMRLEEARRKNFYEGGGLMDFNFSNVSVDR